MFMTCAFNCLITVISYWYERNNENYDKYGHYALLLIIRKNDNCKKK